MSSSSKRRFIIVGGVIVIVIILAAAFIGAGSAATVMTVEQACAADSIGKHVEVEGNVVDDSYSINGDVLDFEIYDPDNPGSTLAVSYDKGVSATFGNGVTAICTGKISDDGTLVCSELVTKCPSKYETSTDALSVSKLLGYGDDIVGKPVKICGILQEGSLADVSNDVRFVLADETGDASVKVAFSSAMPEGASDSSILVVTGTLGEDGMFTATDVAMEG